MDDIGPRHPSATGPATPGDDADLEFSIARSNTLLPLLVMFGLTVLIICVVVVRAKPVVPPRGAVADKAFSPADFPGVFGTDEGIAGLGRRTGRASTMVFPVPAPPFSEGIFPCMQCHEMLPPNPERRTLEMHGEIVFEHDQEHRWCLDCHDKDNRDQLRLASGGLVPFTESYRLCGQCHGTQYRDWRTGIHGKRTGYWDGAKRYLLCVHCHNPHSPRFTLLEPLPPPIRPQFLRPEDALAHAASGGRARAAVAQEEAHAGHTR